MAQPKLKQIGKYDVIDVVGRGGMGVVYKAVDPAIGRTVAIKMMTGAFADDADLLNRFYREARSTGNLQHPNIVTVHDLGDLDGNPYLVMEFLEGESLETIILARRPMSLIDKLGIIVQVCEGLYYAHQRTIVHRDIKPANIVLLKDGTVKIVDFGIARIGNEGLTRPGQVVGSIQFMSPEQINAGHVDSRSDIFSVGVVLFQLLTYELPFEGKDTGSTLLKILNDPPKSLSSLLPECPPELEQIANTALAKEAADRYASAEELGFELARVQESLKQHIIFESLNEVQQLMKEQEWSKAKDKIQSVLKLDRKNRKANEVYREVQAIINKQARSAEAEKLRHLAEEAFAANKLDEAMVHLERAIALDQANTEAFNLHKKVKEAKERALRAEQAMKRAESAMYAGDLEEARQALTEALDLQPDHKNAQVLKAQVEQRIQEAQRQKQLQRVVDEARRQIASRKFTEALETLNAAMTLGATTASLQELIAIAKAGREQEKRRRDLEQLTTQVQDALNSDDYEAACAKVEDGLSRFPNDSGLLKLQLLAQSQRDMAIRRREVEGVIADARRLMESGNAGDALSILNEAARKYPAEANLQALLAIVAETLAREEDKRRKDNFVQAAKENIRNKKYDEAIRVLEEASADFGPADFDSLLRYAKEERAAYEHRKEIEKIAQQAQQLAENEEFEKAVKLLEDALQSGADEELNIVLADVRRAAADYEIRVTECIDTAHRLLRAKKAAEAVKFLESQPATIQRNKAFQSTLQNTRTEQARLQSLAAIEASARGALSRGDFDAVERALAEGYGLAPGDSTLNLIRAELQSQRTNHANSILQRATKDAKTMLLVHSYDSAIEMLDKAASALEYASPDLAGEHRALREQAIAGKAAAEKKKSAPPAAQPDHGSGTAVGGWDQDVTKAASSQAKAGETSRDHDVAHLSALATQAETIVGIPELTSLFSAAETISKKYPNDAAVTSLMHTITGRLNATLTQSGSAVAAPVEQSRAPAATPPETQPSAIKPPTPVKIIEPEAKAVRVSPPSTDRTSKRVSGKQPKPAEKREKHRPEDAQRPSASAPPKSVPIAPAAATPQQQTKSPSASAGAQTAATVPKVVELKPAITERAPAPAKPVHAPAEPRRSNTRLVLGAITSAVVIIVIVGLLARPSKRNLPSPAPSAQPPAAETNPAPSAQTKPEPSSPPQVAETATSQTPVPATPQPETPTSRAPAPAPAPALFKVAGLGPGTTIAIDGRRAGSAARNGSFSMNVSPGDHTIDFQRNGFEPKSMRRTFRSGETLSLNRSDVQLQPVQRVTAQATPPAAPPKTSSDNEAQQEWNRMSRNNDIGELEQFAKKYPSSPLAAEAIRKADQIRTEAANRPVTLPPAKVPVVASPSPSPPSPPASKPADAAATDRQAILGLLSTYTSAYNNRNAAALAQIWPTLKKGDFKKIENSFKNASSIRLALRPINDPVIAGDSATITCSRVLEYTLPQGSPKPLEDTITLRMRRQNGVWVLESVQ